MSVRVMSLVFDATIDDMKYKKDGEDRTAKGSTIKLLLLAYADHSNDEGEGAYPGYTRLEVKTSLSRQGIADTIEAIKQNNLAVFTGKSKLHTNSYTLNLKQIKTLVKPLDSDITPESSHLTPPSQATLPEGVKPLDLNHPKPSLNPSIDEVVKKANAEVDAILAQMRLSAGKSWTKLPEIYHPYAKAFCAATGLEYVKKNLYDWIGVFEEWQAQKYLPEDVITAVQAIADEGRAGTISAPRSVTHKLNGIKVSRITRERALQAQTTPEESGEPDWREQWLLDQANRERVDA